MKERILTIVFVMILGVGASGILTGMKFLTEDRIEKNVEIQLKTTILEAFELSYDKNNIEEIFNENLEKKAEEDVTIYRATNGEVGFEFEGGGLWGPIGGFITLNQDLETIKSIQIMYQEETPGLGGIVAEKEYLDQFKGKKVMPQIIINKDNGSENADNEVDAITGATMTSKAFETLLNNNIKKHKEILVK